MCVLHLCGDQYRTVRTNKPGMRAHAKRDTQKLPLRATREGGATKTRTAEPSDYSSGPSTIGSETHEATNATYRRCPCSASL